VLARTYPHCSHRDTSAKLWFETFHYFLGFRFITVNCRGINGKFWLSQQILKSL